MPKNHSYILGINAYDHDVSACLLRDGEIAYAIEKERITRQKHAGGFFQEVVDYCLQPKASRSTMSIWWCAIATCCRSRIWKSA